MKYEYRTIAMNESPHSIAGLDKLDQYGAEGWEAVQYEEHTRSSYSVMAAPVQPYNFYVVLLKRAVVALLLLACTTMTIMVDGKVMICTSCCFGGSCQTNCTSF